jgi:hypothetical protein
MDFRFAEEEEAFRKEVKDFLQGALLPDWLGVDQGMCHQNGVKDTFITLSSVASHRTSAKD